MVQNIHTYAESFVTMQYWFIGICFAEFGLFTIFAVRAAFKFLPVFTSEGIMILIAFLMCYLVQAALFLRVRKHLGPHHLDKENN